MRGTPVPLKVAGAGLSHVVVEHPHGLHYFLFDLGTAYYLVRREEVVRHGNQRVPGPPAEPIDGAPADQPGKPERPVAELLANLRVHGAKVCVSYTVHKHQCGPNCISYIKLTGEKHRTTCRFFLALDMK